MVAPVAGGAAGRGQRGRWLGRRVDGLERPDRHAHRELRGRQPRVAEDLLDNSAPGR